MAWAPLVELVTHPAPCGEVRSYSLVEFFFGEREQIPPATQRYSLPILVGVRQADAGEVRRVKGRYCERRPALPVLVERLMERPTGNYRVSDCQDMNIAASRRALYRLPDSNVDARSFVEHKQDVACVESLEAHTLVGAEPKSVVTLRQLEFCAKRLRVHDSRGRKRLANLPP